MSARLVAVLVHAVGAALVLVGVALLLSPAFLLFKLVLGGLLLAVAWQVRPRPVPLPPGRSVERAQAPLLFGLLDEVAAATGGTTPRRVVFDSSARASAGRAGGGTYVSVGLPMWAAAGPEARVATLAEQLGRLASGASIVDPLVVSASQSLADWQYFFTPGSTARYQAMDDVLDRDVMAAMSARPEVAQSRLLELLLAVLLFPLYASVSLLRRQLSRLAGRDLRVGLERGRAAAARAVDGAPTVLGRTGALASTVQAQMESASRRDPRASLWEIGTEQRLPSAATALLTAEDSDRIDEELRPVLTRAEQDLREAARA